MKRKTIDFEYLEHTADIYVAAYGQNLAEAYENAAVAMFESMTDTADIKPRLEKRIEARGHDKQSLLYDWLEKLLILFEVENMLCSKFNVEKIETANKGLRLIARILGEQFDPERHKQKVGIKAVTYHRMEIEEDKESVTVRFILDI